MPIPNVYMHNVCQPGQTGACRYLAYDGQGPCCAKVVPSEKAAVDRRMADGQMNATGDNCPGWTDDQPDV